MNKILIAANFIFLLGCNKTVSIDKKESLSQTQESIDLLKSEVEKQDFIIADKTIVYEKLNFGNGYNSATMHEYFGVIKYDNYKESTELIANAQGNTGFVNVSLNEDKTTLRQTMNMSFKAELDFMIKGLKSNNDYKNEVYRETKFTALNQNVVVKSVYTNEPIVLINPEMREKILEEARGNEIKFMKKYGDVFVSKIFTGGELIASFQLSSVNQYEKEENTRWAKSLNEYADFKLSGEWEKKTTFEKDKNSLVKDVKVITKGGGSIGTITNNEQLVEEAFKFKEKVGESAVVLFVELSPYESLPGFPQDFNFSPIRINQKDYLISVSEMLGRIETSMNNARIVLERRTLFNTLDIKQANETLKKYSIKQNELKLLGENCINNFENCNITELKNYYTLNLYTPSIKYPFNIEIDKNFPLIPDKEFQVQNNTFPEANKYFINILGQISFVARDNPSELITSEPKFLKESRYAGRDSRNVPVMIGKKKKYINIWENYSKPYYELVYRNIKTNDVVSVEPWTGTPINLKPNYRLNIRLVNPNSNIVNNKGNLRRRISPFYKTSSITQYGNSKPRIIISKASEVNNTKVFKNAVMVVSDNLGQSYSIKEREDKKPKMVLKNGYWVLENYD